MHTEFTESFEYEVYTDNKDKYYIKVYVCDKEKIHDPLLINYGTEQQ